MNNSGLGKDILSPGSILDPVWQQPSIPLKCLSATKPCIDCKYYPLLERDVCSDIGRSDMKSEEASWKEKKLKIEKINYTFIFIQWVALQSYFPLNVTNLNVFLIKNQWMFTFTAEILRRDVWGGSSWLCWTLIYEVNEINELIQCTSVGCCTQCTVCVHYLCAEQQLWRALGEACICSASCEGPLVSPQSVTAVTIYSRSCSASICFYVQSWRITDLNSNNYLNWTFNGRR